MKTKQLEIFKDIPSYEGIYQISNLGRVKSLKFKKERILKLCDDKQGYLIVNLYKNSKHKSIRVHQLVAIAFLNHKTDGHNIVVDHIDFNRQNNNVKNLRLITNRENTNLKHIPHSSKYTGVCWSKQRKRWQANIEINGKLKHLGYFTNEDEAGAAYQKALNNI